MLRIAPPHLPFLLLLLLYVAISCILPSSPASPSCIGLAFGRDYTFLWSLKPLSPLFIILPFVALNYLTSRKKRVKRQRDARREKEAEQRRSDDGDGDGGHGHDPNESTANNEEAVPLSSSLLPSLSSSSGAAPAPAPAESVLSLDDYAKQRELELVHTKSVKTILIFSMLFLVFGVSSCATVWYCPESPQDGDGLRRSVMES